MLCPPPGDLPSPGMELRSPALQEDSLLSEPAAKPMNTRVGNLSLPQGIFPTQESNWGLLHCRWILYHLSYQESPSQCICISNYCFLYFFKFKPFILTLLVYLFWPHCMTCGILVPQAGIKSLPPSLEARCLHHWTTEELSLCVLKHITILLVNYVSIKLKKSMRFLRRVHNITIKYPFPKK